MAGLGNQVPLYSKEETRWHTPTLGKILKFLCRKMQVKEMLQGMCCISLEITENVGFEHMVPNVIGGEKVKTQPELEHRASGIPCQHSNIWAKKTWYTTDISWKDAAM